MALKRLYVIRHCQATGQSADAPLTEGGRLEAERLAQLLNDEAIQLVICSPYVRARQTIAPFLQQANIPILVDERLKERVLSTHNLDDWQSCLRRTFDDPDLVFEGGESSRCAMTRAVDVTTDILENGPHRVALVTHGNLMALMLRYFDESVGFEEWANLSNPDVFLIEVDDARTRVRRIWGESTT